MGERDDARRSIEDARERMSAIAEELARRASPGFMKDRAREVAVRKTSEVRDRAASSPGAWSILGGILGATAGAAMGRRARQRRELSAAGDRWEPAVKTYEYGYASPSGYNPETSPYGAAPVSGVPEYGLGVESGGWENRGGEPSRSDQMKERARERASELKHRASDKTEELKQRFRGRSEDLRERSHRARERIPEMRGRARGAYQRGVQDRPLALALGAIGLGFAASFLVPVTQRERQLAGPARSKVRSRIESMESQLESRIGGDSGARPSAGYDASSAAPSGGGAWSSPSPSSAPYYGEDVGVVEDTSSESGSRFFESSPDESGGGRTIH